MLNSFFIQHLYQYALKRSEQIILESERIGKELESISKTKPSNNLINILQVLIRMDYFLSGKALRKLIENIQSACCF